MKQPKIVTGFKATDKNMKCRDHQFELGVWYEVEGDLELCKNGFHFCKYPSGPSSYYNDPSTRIFKVEAEDVLDAPVKPGADYKLVARRIRLVEEVFLKGSCNTGNWNTGDCNTGNRNTGYRNTGDCNTGNWNTGDYNTGYRNTGDCNTGNRNTGDYNTGDYNAGRWNTGERNTGNANIGNGNTGMFNKTNRCSGFLCVKEPKAYCFDLPTNFTFDDFTSKFTVEILYLESCITNKRKPNKNELKNLPNFTEKRFEAWCKKYFSK